MTGAAFIPPVHRRGLVAGGLVMAALISADLAGLRINGTASMPRGLWHVGAPVAPLRRGEIVTLCPPETLPFREAAARGYLPAGFCPGGLQPLVKPIAAIAGDLVTVSAAGVTVNGAPVPARNVQGVARPLWVLR